MSETARLDGLTMEVERAPRATRPPLLFVHGMFGGAWYFANYLRFFAARGHDCYALNLRGHHDSRPVPDLGRLSVMDYVADAMDVARSIGRPIVVGHSMGGLIAQKMAESDAVRAAVLLCAAPPRGITVASWLLLRKQTKFVGALLGSRPVLGELEDHVALSLNRTPEVEREPAYRRMVPESGRAGREISIGTIAVNARRVRCPVLSVGASDDRFVVPRVARALARKYRCTYMEFAGHGHFILAEPGWEIPAGIIGEWIRGAVPEPV